MEWPISFEPLADQETLLDRLKFHQNIDGPVSLAERFAAVVSSKGSDEVSELKFEEATANALIEQFEQAEAVLIARLEIVHQALLRMKYWALVTEPKDGAT